MKNIVSFPSCDLIKHHKYTTSVWAMTAESSPSIGHNMINNCCLVLPRKCLQHYCNSPPPPPSLCPSSSHSLCSHPPRFFSLETVVIRTWFHRTWSFLKICTFWKLKYLFMLPVREKCRYFTIQFYSITSCALHRFFSLRKCND